MASIGRLEAIHELTRATHRLGGENDIGQRLPGTFEGAIDVVGEHHGEAIATQHSRQRTERIEIGSTRRTCAPRFSALSVQEPHADRLPTHRSVMRFDQDGIRPVQTSHSAAIGASNEQVGPVLGQSRQHLQILAPLRGA